ncbi:MAG: S41 family peptidase [Alphaproteobacteria bacterium]
MRFFRSLACAGFASLWILATPAGLTQTKPDTNEEAFDQMRIFADIFATVRENYVEEVEDADLIDNALNGALESLDPHSHYVPQKQFEDNQKTSRREYGGLGIEVSLEDELVKINYVIQDGPAGKAGVKAGDFVTAVAGSDVRGKTLDDAVDGMRGLAGDPIIVTILSEGQEPRDVTIIREVVQGRVVRHRVEDGIGYMYIESFSHPRLGADVAFALKDLQASLGGTIPGLIIDVRGNPGGLVDQTVEVASHFLDGGEVFSARGRTIDNTQRYNAKDGELTPNVPIVVLANSRSASAAEILAGAIQDRGRGIVMGRRTFGKGSVQSVIPLMTSGGALRLTTQRYFTPSGKSIQGRGIMPDVLVALRPDSGDKRKRFRESSFANALQNPDESDFEEDMDAIDYPPADWPMTSDYQLKKAVELVKSPTYKNVLASLTKP